MKLSSIVFLSIGSFANFAFAGGDSSGGGPSVVCRAADHSITSARILDLFEGEILDGLTMTGEPISVATAIADASAKLGQVDIFLKYDFDDAVNYMYQHTKWLPDGIIIDHGVDLGSDHAVPVPNGCTVEYVGFFESTGFLRVSKTLFDKLSVRDQAAFYVHEALYKVGRARHFVRNSSSTRQLNSRLFATAEGNLAQYAEDFIWEDVQDARVGFTKLLSENLNAPMNLKVTATSYDNNYGWYIACYDDYDWKSKPRILITSYDSLPVGKPVQFNMPAQGCGLITVQVGTGVHDETTNLKVEIKLGQQTLAQSSHGLVLHRIVTYKRR